MPTIDEILNIAKVKGFIIKDKKALDIVDHVHEFLFILKNLYVKITRLNFKVDKSLYKSASFWILFLSTMA